MQSDQDSEDLFICADCDEIFEKARTDEEANAEAATVFRPEQLVNLVLVCPGCYGIRMSNLRAEHPEVLLDGSHVQLPGC